MKILSNTNTNKDITAKNQIISEAANGTPPLVVSSATLVPNLNADKLDGQDGSYYQDWANITNKPTIPSIPSVMTTTEGNAGTATTQRTINALNLKSIILNHSPAGARPASDVSSWAKAATKPSYSYTEVGAAASSHTHTKSEISDFPTSMPASDVYAWAKAANKPSYAWTEITSKPTFATVATSGSYADLSNKPTIPTIPSVMDTTEGNTGTATTQRTINAANLKSIILNHSPAGSRPASSISDTILGTSTPSETTFLAGNRQWKSISFSVLTGKPDTLSGYGITDAAAKTHSHSATAIGVSGISVIGKSDTGGGTTQELNMTTLQGMLGLGSLAYSSATIPTNTNQLTNGAGYITSSGSITGNAATATYATSAGSVTNGVYIIGNQTIGGVKTFSSTISGSINGNAATATTASDSSKLNGQSASYYQAASTAWHTSNLTFSYNSSTKKLTITTT